MTKTDIRCEHQRSIFFGAIIRGLPRYAAAAYAGISATTLASWVKKGKDNFENEDAEENIFGAWYKELIAAESGFQLELVVPWVEQGRENYRAARDYLAVRFPEHYRDKDRPQEVVTESFIVIERDGDRDEPSQGGEGT